MSGLSNIESISYSIRSSSAHIRNELGVQQRVLLAVVLPDETHAGHDDQDEQQREEELDEVGAVDVGRDCSLQLNHM